MHFYFSKCKSAEILNIEVLFKSKSFISSFCPGIETMLRWPLGNEMSIHQCHPLNFIFDFRKKYERSNIEIMYLYFSEALVIHKLYLKLVCCFKIERRLSLPCM